jgi:hypothetical protein
MMHWSASRSNEYCSLDNNAIPLPCGAAKSCPISDGYAVFWDTFSVKILMLPVLPDVVCVDEHSPKAFCDEHRKKPASGPNSSNEIVGPLDAGWFTYLRISFF